MNQVQRSGIDHDPVKPWNWADGVLHPEPMEIVSYPIFPDGVEFCGHERKACKCSIMVRLKVGDPTSLAKVPLKQIAAFSPDRHQDFYRPKVYYSDNPTAFIFTDELEAHRNQ